MEGLRGGETNQFKKFSRFTVSHVFEIHCIPSTFCNNGKWAPSVESEFESEFGNKKLENRNSFLLLYTIDFFTQLI